jgi:hypothetical protein
MTLALQPSTTTLSPRSPTAHRSPQRATQPSWDLQLGAWKSGWTGSRRCPSRYTTAMPISAPDMPSIAVIRCVSWVPGIEKPWDAQPDEYRASQGADQRADDRAPGMVGQPDREVPERDAHHHSCDDAHGLRSPVPAAVGSWPATGLSGPVVGDVALVLHLVRSVRKRRIVTRDYPSDLHPEPLPSMTSRRDVSRGAGARPGLGRREVLNPADPVRAGS